MRPWVRALAIVLLLAVPVDGAVTSARIAVTTSPTLISQSGSEIGHALLKNTGAASVFLGGADVTTTTGYEFAVGETLSITLGSNEALYGIVATGTVLVHKLENRK